MEEQAIHLLEGMLVSCSVHRLLVGLEQGGYELLLLQSPPSEVWLDGLKWIGPLGHKSVNHVSRGSLVTGHVQAEGHQADSMLVDSRWIYGMPEVYAQFRSGHALGRRPVEKHVVLDLGQGPHPDHDVAHQARVRSLLHLVDRLCKAV
jgi:hypothetical protein